jgi:minor histocompatibility antigen H13
LLWGLFFYDIFWVYGTDVMLTVAKNFDAPIKLMFPYDWLADPPKFSMLGLGDIVIPGIFVALCLKYDIDRNIGSVGKNEHSIKTPYFNWCFGGYIFGILTTYFVMVFFEHPQPALLFLVPSCTFAVLIKSFLDGKYKDLWTYEDKAIEIPKELKEVKSN